MSTITTPGEPITFYVAGRGQVTGIRIPNSSIKITPADDPTVAEFKRRTAEENARLAQSAKEREELSRPYEREGVAFPNVQGLSQEGAARHIPYIQSLIASGKSNGKQIIAANGEKTTQSLDVYLSWLQVRASGGSATDETSNGSEIGEKPDTTGKDHLYLPNITTLSTLTANSVYHQIESMVNDGSYENKIVHAYNGAYEAPSIQTYLEWVGQKAGIVNMSS